MVPSEEGSQADSSAGWYDFRQPRELAGAFKPALGPGAFDAPCSRSFSVLLNMIYTFYLSLPTFLLLDLILGW